MNNTSQYIEKSLSYLASSDALQSIERDPYWPKWDSPWWHMSLLNEMGLAKDIPKSTVSKMVQGLKNFYLPIFPINECDIPKGTDPFRKIACLCAVGNMYQILFNAGVNVDHELPWMKEWFFRYQLPDGGLNCDEQVYTKPEPKSSIVTTLSCLEAVLFCRRSELTQNESTFLTKGANYLLKHRLFRRTSTGEVIYKDWLEIRFPRFYEYDFLRGFYFLAKWRQQSGFAIPDDLVDEVEDLVSQQMTTQGIQLKQYNLFDKRSYNPIDDGTWAWGSASEIDLMKAVSYEGCICQPLTLKWNEVKPKTAVVIDSKKDDTTELTASVGEKIKIYYEESDRCWSRNKNGVKGWISKKHLEILS